MAVCSRDQSYVMPRDWEARNAILDRKSQDVRVASKQDRFFALQEKLDAGAQGRWAEHCSRVALRSRIADVQKVQWTFSRCLTAIVQENSSLVQLLMTTENAQDDLHHILDVVRQCLTLRGEKPTRELVNDDAHSEIRKTRDEVQGAVRTLQDICNEAQVQLQALQDLRHDVEKAIRCQQEALKVDSDQLQLDVTSPGISLKPDPLRQPDGTLSKSAWRERAYGLLTTADDTLRKCRSLRDDARFALVRVRQTVADHCEALLYALRKRIHDQDQATKHLQHQECYLSQELASLGRNVSDTEAFRRDLHFPIKVAQTRFENRSQRRPPELCFDDAQRNLYDEVETWSSAQCHLEGRLARSRHRMDELERHLAEVRQDLGNKMASLNIDRQCLETSKRIVELPLCKPASNGIHFEALPEPALNRSAAVASF